MNESLTIRLGEKLAHALQEEARKTGLAKGEVVRQALESRLKHRGKLAVIRRNFGVINGPPDLSTNKTYKQSWTKKRT